MLLMSSSIVTVLPTPAPPKRPILPPFAKGQMRSTTLMPVSSSSTEGESSSNFGAAAWIERCSSAFTGPRSSIGRPRTSITRPRVAGPTGTEIAAPVFFTRMPRRSPSDEPIELLRVLAPEAFLRERPAFLDQRERVIHARHVVARKLDVDDRADALDDLAFVRFGLNRAHELVSRLDSSDGGSAAHNLGQFLRDRGLPRLVVDEGEVVDDAGGVVARGFHRHHPRGLLARDVLGDRLVDDLLHIAGEELVQHRARIGLVQVVPV